jgi:hypothetical protein
VKGNDLGNSVVPRDALVWEGLLGLINDPRVAKQEKKFREKEQWDNAVACYEVNELLARKIWDLTWRWSMEIELLTYLGVEFAQSLEKRMEREDMPFRRVWFDKPNLLARRIATMPNLRTIYDPDPNHQFLYGHRGRIIAPENAHYLLGAM